MARKIAVEIVGDSRQLTRAFSTSTQSAKKFNREISHMGRGVAAGSGLFRSLGRSVAFASGGFLAFASVSEFLRSSVDAARDAAVAQRALGAQMKASGESFREHRAQIEKTTRSYGRFGFQNEQVEASLTVLERGTGSINKAIGLQGLTADLARAKNLDLAAAAQTVAKVFGGQETALRRAVPGLTKTAHGWDLIREAQAKLAGQAAANTTAAERFSATLHDTQEIIGAGLLPVLNTYLDKLSTWMDDTRNQAKLQRGVTTAVKDTSTAVAILGDVFGIAAKGASDYQRFTRFAERHTLGPFRRVVRDTLEPGALLGDVSRLLGRGGAGRAARGPAGARGPITAADVARMTGGPGGPAPAAAGPSGKLLNQWFDTRIGRALDRVQDAPMRAQLGKLQQIAGLVSRRIAVTKDITRRLQLEDTLLQVQRQGKAVRQQLQQAFLDRLQFNVDRAGVTTTLSDDLAALRKLNAVLAQRIRAGGDTLALEQQQLGVQQQITAVLKEQAANAVAARQARQFRLLGFGPGGEDLIPGVKGLKGTLAGVAKAIEGSFLDTKKTRGLLAHIRQVLSGGLGSVGDEVRTKIAQILADLKAQLKQSAVDVTKFHHANPDAIIAAAGLHLTTRQRRRLELAISGIGPGGSVPSFSGQFGGAGAINIYGGVQVQGVQNVKALENELAKRAKQRAHQRRSTR